MQRTAGGLRSWPGQSAKCILYGMIRPAIGLIAMRSRCARTLVSTSEGAIQQQQQGPAARGSHTVHSPAEVTPSIRPGGS